jgi:hypothetical protein
MTDFRAELKALGPIKHKLRNRPANYDWHKHWFKRGKIGDQVFDVADPTHQGTIQSIMWSSYAVVRWNETGWLSDVFFNNMRPVEEE